MSHGPLSSYPALCCCDMTASGISVVLLLQPPCTLSHRSRVILMILKKK